MGASCGLCDPVWTWLCPNVGKPRTQKLIFLARPIAKAHQSGIDWRKKGPWMARIRLGMVGGGQGALIGAVHRIAARLDNGFGLVAGALSSDPARAAQRPILGLMPRADMRFTGIWRRPRRRDPMACVRMVCDCDPQPSASKPRDCLSGRGQPYCVATSHCVRRWQRLKRCRRRCEPPLRSYF